MGYPPAWQGELCSFATDPSDALACLTTVVQELQRRRLEFSGLASLHHTTCGSIDDSPYQRHALTVLR